MNKNNINIQYFIPQISKVGLLYLASMVWAFAGGMLIIRGVNGILTHPDFLLLKLASTIFSGMLFYFLLFTKISNKHIQRIINLDNKKMPFYSFFDKKGFFMMFAMITLGITIRLTGIISFKYLALFYVIMGTPLLLSAFRFLYNGLKFKVLKK